MTARTFWLTPLDTLFFRDSQPIDAGPMQGGVESLFPPAARTLAGALRLALARGRGYGGGARWSRELADVLGDGPEDMGKLSFGGPLVALEDEPLYPMPLHVLGDRDGGTFRPRTQMAPGAEVWCDLGRARLPVPMLRETRLHSGGGLFLRRAGLEAVLAGQVPGSEQVVPPEALYAIEGRVGLMRDEHTRTAKDGYLYSTAHVRLLERASLLMEVRGVPEDWVQGCPRLIALGGESRMAELELGAPLLPIAAPVEAIERSGRLTVTLMTPLRLVRESMPRPGEGQPGLPGTRVVSACLGKPVLRGGWDSLKREPLPLRPYLPAGSTWFCTIDPGQGTAVSALHGSCLDVEAALGLGAVALGTWNEIPNA